MVGAAHQLEPSLALGAVGAILAFACPAPTACYEIFAAIKEDDLPLAREKQDRVKQAVQRVVSELGVPGVKYAMDLNGYYGGTARLPFLPLTGDQKSQSKRQCLTSATDSAIRRHPVLAPLCVTPRVFLCVSESLR